MEELEKCWNEHATFSNLVEGFTIRVLEKEAKEMCDIANSYVHLVNEGKTLDETQLDKINKEAFDVDRAISGFENMCDVFTKMTRKFVMPQLTTLEKLLAESDMAKVKEDFIKLREGCIANKKEIIANSSKYIGKRAGASQSKLVLMRPAYHK